MMLPMLPTKAVAAGSDADARSGETDVLMFSPYLSSRGEAFETLYLNEIVEVYEEKGYTVQKKLGKETEQEQHLTEEDMEGIGLLILFFPYRSCSDEDIALMRKFLQGGGRIVMMGENGKNFPTENMFLTETAQKLGGGFQISTRSVGDRHTIRVDSQEMPKTSLTEKLTYGLSCSYVAPISYTGSVQPVLYYEDHVWAVEQAVEQGRIFAFSDINCFDSLWNPNVLYSEDVGKITADTEQ